MSKPSFYISCPFDTYSGYGARSRDIVKAIIDLDKYNVKLLSQRWGDTTWGFCEAHEKWSFLKDYAVQGVPQGVKPDIWMQITIPNEFMPNGHYNIGMTAGIESTVAPMDWVQGCGRMNMVLGSSKHSIDILKGTTFDKRDERTKQVIEKIQFNPNTKTDVLFEGFNEDTYKKTNEILDKIPSRSIISQEVLINAIAYNVVKLINFENEKIDLEQILHDKSSDTEIVEMAEKDLNLIGALQESEWKLYKSLLPYYTKGMNYVVYQIRVYGVDKKNQSKFDKLYKDVVAFFQLIAGHRRRYFKEDLDKLSNEYLRAKTHLAKAIEVIEKLGGKIKLIKK